MIIQIPNLMKIILTIISSLFIISFSQAQSRSDQEEVLNPEWRQSGDFVFGAYAGFSTNTLSPDLNGQLINGQNIETEEFDIDGNGFIIGLQADFYFGKNWSIKGRLNYERRDYSLGIIDNTIAIPLQAAWHFGKNRRWHLALGTAYNVSIDESMDSDFGGAFSIGIITPIKNAKFFIELDGITQLDAGLISITDNDGNPAGSTSFDTNRSSINIGILF
jgi:hypothetical protein